MSRPAFIIGGTGQIGRAVANDLLGLGWEVLATHGGRRAFPGDLTEKGAKAVVLDRAAPGALARAIGSGLDAILDTTAYPAKHADQLLEIEGDVGSFVVISSSSVYRDGAGRTLDEAAKRRDVFPVLVSYSHEHFDYAAEDSFLQRRGLS